MHRLYENEEITVFWNSEKCFHAKKCVTGCPEAFDITRKPWIDISRAPTKNVWQAVSACPSGALTCVYNHDVRIIFSEEEKKSEAWLEEKKIGECCFTASEGQWGIYHTEVDPAYGHKGIAKRLVYAILQEAERKGGSVSATCSYAAGLL